MRKAVLIMSVVFFCGMIFSCTQRTCPTYTDTKTIKEMPIQVNTDANTEEEKSI